MCLSVLRAELYPEGNLPCLKASCRPMHLILILFIALLFFGPSKLGELGKELGDGIRHIKDAVKEGSGDSKPEPRA